MYHECTVLQCKLIYTPVRLDWCKTQGRTRMVREWINDIVNNLAIGSCPDLQMKCFNLLDIQQIIYILKAMGVISSNIRLIKVQQNGLFSSKTLIPYTKNHEEVLQLKNLFRSLFFLHFKYICLKVSCPQCTSKCLHSTFDTLLMCESLRLLEF